DARSQIANAALPGCLRRGRRLVPFSSSLDEGMERREAPGVCEAPMGGLRGLPGALLDRERPRALPGWGCEAHPDGDANPVPRRARAVISRRAKPRHRTAAPPGAPPADCGFPLRPRKAWPDLRPASRPALPSDDTSRETSP